MRWCALAVMLAACGAPAKPTTLSNETSGTTEAVIAGHVRDKASHAVLPGATVLVTLQGGHTRSTVTDDRASFRITDVPAGTHVVTVYYADATSTQSVVVPSETAAHLEVAMDLDTGVPDYLEPTP